MMKRQIPFGLCVIISLLINLFVSSDVTAEILGEFRDTGWVYGWSNMEFDTLNVELGSSSTELDWYITIDDIGETFTATYGDSGFEELRTLLSNGADDLFHIFKRGPGGGAPVQDFYESEMENYFGTVPDFIGSDITAILLTVNDLVWEYPVAMPHHPEFGEIYNYVEYDLTVSIEGIPVPGPSTLLLLGLGAVVLRRKRR